jgi:hypothetical protein
MKLEMAPHAAHRGVGVIRTGRFPSVVAVELEIDHSAEHIRRISAGVFLEQFVCEAVPNIIRLRPTRVIILNDVAFQTPLDLMR